MLIPSNEKTEKFVERLEKQSLPIYRTSNNDNNDNKKVQIRSIQTLTETGSTILIVDKKVSLVMELKDDSKEKFHEAIGDIDILTEKQVFYLMFQYSRTCGIKPNYTSS